MSLDCCRRKCVQASLPLAARLAQGLPLTLRMIEYSHGRWGMQVLLKCRGSVIPKALVWSVPCALLTVLLHIYWGDVKGDANTELEGIGTIWSGYTFVLGFLIVFRSNQAYSRFWESAASLTISMAVWFHQRNMSSSPNLFRF